MPDADVHTHRGGHTVACRDGPLDLDGERDEPAVGGSGNGGGQDAGTALLEATGKLPSGFMGFEHADARELDVPAVGQHLDGAGSESAGVAAAPLPFRVREPDQAALAAAVP